MASSLNRSPPLVKEHKIQIAAAANEEESRCFQLFHQAGSRSHVLLFAPGFMSCSLGKKAKYLKTYCGERDLDLVLYDPEGLGASKVPDFSLTTFSHWTEDCEASLGFIRDSWPTKKILLIGSSMGGNIALRLAEKQSKTIWKLLLIAPSLDTAGPRMERTVRDEFTEEQKRDWDSGEKVAFDTLAGPMPFRKSFLEDVKKASLSAVARLDIQCPVKILHGYQDDIVPYQGSIKLLEVIGSGTVDLLLRKDADHSFSRKQDLDFMALVLDEMIKE